MIDLSLSDYIGIATSILSLVATVIVAFMEDLFLQTLFGIYIHLVLSKKEC